MNARFLMVIGSTFVLGACVQFVPMPPHQPMYDSDAALGRGDCASLPVPPMMPMYHPIATLGGRTMRPYDQQETSLEELEAMTSRIKQRNRLPGSHGLQLDADVSGGTASIRTNGQDGMISIHPARLRSVPSNAWAFILGHELAHQVLILETGYPGSEVQADVAGAHYAARAGYDPAAYLAWVMRTQGPGARQRVNAIGNSLGVSPQSVWENLR